MVSNYNFQTLHHLEVSWKTLLKYKKFLNFLFLQTISIICLFSTDELPVAFLGLWPIIPVQAAVPCFRIHRHTSPNRTSHHLAVCLFSVLQAPQLLDGHLKPSIRIPSRSLCKEFGSLQLLKKSSHKAVQRQLGIPHIWSVVLQVPSFTSSAAGEAASTGQRWLNFFFYAVFIFLKLYILIRKVSTVLILFLFLSSLST